MITYSPANWSWRVHSYFTSLRVICKVITTLDMSTSNNNEISTQQNNLTLLPSHLDYQQSWNGSHTDIICFSKKISYIGSMKDVIVSQLTHAYDHDLQTQQALNSKQTQKYAEQNIVCWLIMTTQLTRVQNWKNSKLVMHDYLLCTIA